MSSVIENFFKTKLLNSKISVFLAMTLSVLIMGLLGLLAINYNSLEDLFKESVSFNLVMNNAAQELETQQLIKSLSLINGVKSINYISKTESAQKMQDNLGEDFIQLIGENPLKNIIEIKYYADYINSMNSELIKEKFLLYDQIEDVLYDQNIIDLLEKNFKRLGLIFSFVAAFFFLIAFVLINSNIRLTIYSKRFIIKTMQLVGATKKFIQNPFLKTNFILSIVSCFLGNGILLVLLLLVINKIPEIKHFISIKQLIYLILLTSTINLGIAFFSTWVCVRRYLNLRVDDLYK